jgi:small-conductance mechanosensitive channel
MTERGNTYQKRRRVKKKKLQAHLQQRVLVLRIVLKETLTIDVERAYAGILPEEKALLNESVGQALKHIDNVLKRLEKLSKETNQNGKQYDGSNNVENAFSKMGVNHRRKLH